MGGFGGERGLPREPCSREGTDAGSPQVSSAVSGDPRPCRFPGARGETPGRFKGLGRPEGLSNHSPRGSKAAVVCEVPVPPSFFCEYPSREDPNSDPLTPVRTVTESPGTRITEALRIAPYPSVKLGPEDQGVPAVPCGNPRSPLALLGGRLLPGVLALSCWPDRGYRTRSSRHRYVPGSTRANRWSGRKSGRRGRRDSFRS